MISSVNYLFSFYFSTVYDYLQDSGDELTDSRKEADNHKQAEEKQTLAS